MTKTMRVLLALVAVALMVAAFGGTAQADTQSLVVNDPSFENLGNPDGSPQAATDVPTQTGYYPDNDPSQQWVSGNDFYNNTYSSGQWAQVNGDDAAVEWRPTSGQFAVPIPNGVQVLASSDNSNWPTPGFGGEVGILQTLDQANPTWGKLQANTTYTITVSAGKVLGQSFEGVYPGFADPTAQIELGNGGLDEWYTTDGTFQDVSFSFTTDYAISQGASIGDQLAAFVDFGGEGAVVDNVRVTAVTEAVPEPSTLVLLAAGVIGLLAYAWRKRK